MNVEQMLILAQAQNDQGGGAGSALGFLCLMVLNLGILVIIFASLWKLFVKAGKPGWAGIIPIYNIVVMLEIVGRPLWWIILFLIPCVNWIVGIILCIDLAKSFGKDTAFAIGLILLSFVFLPILAFGDARYVGPAAKGPATI